MQKILCLAAALLSSAAIAQTPPAPSAGAIPPIPKNIALPPFEAAVPLDAQFTRGLALSELVKVVLFDVLNKPYVVASEIVLDQSPVAVSVKGLKANEALAVLERTLKQRGYTIELRNNVYYIEKKAEEGEREFTRENMKTTVYRPKAADTRVFSEQLPGLFPKCYFSFGRRQQTSEPESARQDYSQRTSVESSEDKKPVQVFVAQCPESVKGLNEVLNALDVKTPQVRVRGGIYEVGRQSGGESGVRLALNVLGGKAALDIGSDAARGVLAIENGVISAALKRLETEGGFNSISTPELTVGNGEKAEIQVGASVPTLGATTETEGGGTTQSVTYQEVGTILRVAADIREEMIKLEVEVELSDAVETKTGVQSTPTLTKRKLKTSVSAKSGEAIVIGGLRETRESKAKQKNWFITTDKKKAESENELVIVLYIEKE